MRPLARRAALALPLLALGGRGARPFGRGLVPAFPHWVGRTALLSGDGGAARLLLAEDGTGMMAVRLFLFCRALPIHRWSLAADGHGIRYARASALDSSRVIEGEAVIEQEHGRILWIEAARHHAVLEGFAERAAAGTCR
jgi:hypothetical protein